MKCEDCKYWDQIGDFRDNLDDMVGGYLGNDVKCIGFCMRYPPIRIQEMEELFQPNRYPKTLERYWCGEYESKKPIYPTLEALDLKPLTEMILIDGGIDSVEKLVDCTPKYIKGLRGIGSCAYRAIQESLNKFGLYINGTMDGEVLWIIKEAAEAEATADAAVREALGIEVVK